MPQICKKREHVRKICQEEYLASVTRGSNVQGCATKPPLTLNFQSTCPDCSTMSFANIINMTNHWSSQLRRQSPNHIILTDLEDLQSFTNLHQPTISGSPYSLLNFTMWSGVLSMFCPGYCHRCVWSYSSNICNGFAFIHQHAVTCKCHVCIKHVSSHTHHGPQQLSSLPKKPYVFNVWRGKYHLQHHKKGSSSHNGFC